MPKKFDAGSEGARRGKEAAKFAKESIQIAQATARDVADFTKAFVESFRNEIRKNEKKQR